jgi:Arc/MetJ-type ribon-helix-helix transcriptional regulator
MAASMAAASQYLRDKTGESEKLTMNVGFVDLGRIDLLVQEGFYSNRTDFIRTAIRRQLAAHEDIVKETLVRHTLELGLRRYTSADLKAIKAAGTKLRIQVVGLAIIDEDVTPELALATIESITVLGALQASKTVKSALADRIR